MTLPLAVCEPQAVLPVLVLSGLVHTTVLVYVAVLWPSSSVWSDETSTCDQDTVSLGHVERVGLRRLGRQRVARWWVG